VCGEPLGAQERSRSVPGAPAAGPRAPNVKRRTVYEPDAEAGAPSVPSPVFGGLPLRAPIDPANPFGPAGTAPSSSFVARQPVEELRPPQPPPPPFQRSKSRTIIEPGRDPSARVEAALFAYSGSSDPGTVHPLRTGRNIIGRGDDCDVVLDDNRVSAQHAYLFVRPDDATFMDVSTNGSELNGKPLLGEQERITETAARIVVGATQLVFVRIPKELLKSIRP
jgi:hypothetical protein